MNYKGFKKISSDNKCTTLMHPDGHELKIAHKSLSKKIKGELDGLPSHEPKRMARGGQVKRYAEGTPNEPVGGQSAWDRFKSDVSGAANELAPDDSPPEGYKNSYSPGVSPNQSAAHAPVIVNVNSGQPPERTPAEQQAPQAQVPENSQPVPAQSPAPAKSLVQQQPLQRAAAPSPMSVPQNDIPEQGAQYSAPQNMGQDNTTGSAPYERAYNDYKQAHLEEFARDDAAYEHDLANGHITPQTYGSLFAKKDTLGKIGTLFGVMLSGMGSGLTGQPNAALAAMNQEINNDLQAQVQNKGNAQNFIKLNQAQQRQNADIEYMKKQGMLTEAQAKHMMAEANMKSYTFAQLQANRTAFHNQALMVAKMPEGPQKEQAKQALAMMGIAVGNENANLSDIASSKMALMSQLGGQNGDTTALRMMGMKDMAENIERKSIPGIPGRAKIDVPQDTREQLKFQKQYDEKAREYVDFAKKYSKNWANMNLTERQRIANQGGAMAANLQSLYRNKIKGGVYKKGEQEFIEQIIPDQPAKWSSSFNAIPKVEQTIHDNMNDLKNTAGSVGINYGGNEKSSSGQQMSRSGKPIVFKNGKWVYQQ